MTGKNLFFNLSAILAQVSRELEQQLLTQFSHSSVQDTLRAIIKSEKYCLLDLEGMGVLTGLPIMFCPNPVTSYS